MQNQHNKHSKLFLAHAIQESGWSDATLAERAGLPRSTVSKHLSGVQVIRRTHLRHYLRALPPVAGLRLFLAWLRDDGLYHDVVAALIQFFAP